MCIRDSGIALVQVDVTRMDSADMTYEPRGFIERASGAVSEVQARGAEPQRRFAQQIADLQGSSARSVSR